MNYWRGNPDLIEGKAAENPSEFLTFDWANRCDPGPK